MPTYTVLLVPFCKDSQCGSQVDPLREGVPMMGCYHKEDLSLIPPSLASSRGGILKRPFLDDLKG